MCLNGGGEKIFCCCEILGKNDCVFFTIPGRTGWLYKKLFASKINACFHTVIFFFFPGVHSVWIEDVHPVPRVLASVQPWGGRARDDRRRHDGRRRWGFFWWCLVKLHKSQIDDSWSQLYFCLHFSCNSVLRVSWRDMVFAAGVKKDTLNENQCVSINCQKSRLLNHTSDAFAFLPKKAPLFIHVYQKRRYKMPFPLPPDLHWETKVCVPFCAQKALLFPLGIQRARIALAPFFRYTTTTELLQCRLLFSREKKREKESIPIQGGGGGGKGKKAINRRERRGKVEQGSFFTGKSG